MNTIYSSKKDIFMKIWWDDEHKVSSLWIIIPRKVSLLIFQILPKGTSFIFSQVQTFVLSISGKG